MRAVDDSPRSGPGRLVWGASGLVTAVLLMIPAVRLTTHPSTTSPAPELLRTYSIPQPVSSVDIASDGNPVRIIGADVSRVQVTIAYAGKAGAPPGPGTVSRGRLTLSESGCDDGGWCADAFTLTVPRATSADISTAGGPATVTGLSGTLRADSGGGPVSAQSLTAADVVVTTEGGPAMLGFGAAPRTVTVTSGGGPAQVRVPGGPYALNADSGGGPEAVGVATNPGAGRRLLISTGGGPLQVDPG